MMNIRKYSDDGSVLKSSRSFNSKLSLMGEPLTPQLPELAYKESDAVKLTCTVAITTGAYSLGLDYEPSANKSMKRKRSLGLEQSGLSLPSFLLGDWDKKAHSALNDEKKSLTASLSSDRDSTNTASSSTETEERDDVADCDDYCLFYDPEEES